MLYYPKEDGFEEYVENAGINQSSLKLLLRGAHAYNDSLTEQEAKSYFEEKDYLNIGSAVDCKLTNHPDTFDKKFIVTDEDKKPSEKIVSIIRLAFDSIEQDIPEEISDPSLEVLLDHSITQHEYYNNLKTEVKRAKIINAGAEYWKELKKSKGKIILSQQEFIIVERVVKSIKNNNVVYRLFREQEGEDTVFQYPIFFSYEGVDCKGLLDLIRIDHVSKTIYPIDIKTMGEHVTNFPAAVRKRRYDFQASFYQEGLLQNLDALGLHIGKDLQGYSVANFLFIVESTKYINTSVLFTCTDSLLEIGKWGYSQKDEYVISNPNNGYSSTNKREVLGFDGAIKLLKFHQEHGFNQSKSFIEGDGLIQLNYFSKID